MASPHIIVGRVRKAHGLRGELAVEVMTESPDVIFASGARVFAGNNQGDLSPGAPTLTVTAARPHGRTLLVTFQEVADRTVAEQWRDRFLLVDADEIEPPGPDEVFVHDLPGLDVLTVGGERIGSVTETLDSPAGLLLDIATARGSRLFPMRAEFVVEVDMTTRRIVIDPPVGLFD